MMGQAVWAACQAGVIFFLSSRQDGIFLVGALTFALAIFSPLCLLGSLNTRNLVAIGRGKTTSLLRDVCIRAVVVLVAMLVATVVLFLTEKFNQFTFLTLLLLVLRGADQLSDVSAGYYQKHNNIMRLVFSYCGRGLIPLTVLVIAYGLSSSLAIGIGFSAVVVVIFVVWFDIYVPLRILPREAKVEEKESLEKNGISNAVKLFPFLDSLHANSLRLAVGAIFSAEIVGIFGVIQTAFAPVQIFVSALAQSNLKKLADLSDSSGSKFESLLNNLSVISFLPVVTFGLFWMIVDAPLIAGIFPFLNSSEVKQVGMSFTLSMLLFGPAGFYAQAVLIRRNDKTYGISPVAGLAFFCVFAIGSKAGVLSADLFVMCLCFLLSNALRMLMCYAAISRGSK